MIAEQVWLRIVKFLDGSQWLNSGMHDQHRDRNCPIMSASTTLVARRNRRGARGHRVMTPSRLFCCGRREFQGPHGRDPCHSRDEQQHRGQA